MAADKSTQKRQEMATTFEAVAEKIAGANDLRIT